MSYREQMSILLTWDQQISTNWIQQVIYLKFEEKKKDLFKGLDLTDCLQTPPVLDTSYLHLIEKAQPNPRNAYAWYSCFCVYMAIQAIK